MTGCSKSESLDTVATVEINGTVVLKADNAFRRWRADASSLKHGANRIVITFHSNLAEAARRQRAQPFRVPYHAGNCPLPDGNMLRKAQCHFGWDWNIAIAPFGLYGTIRLVHAPLALPGHVIVRQHHGGDGVRVDVEVGFERRRPGPVSISAQFNGETRSATVDDGERAVFGFEVSDRNCGGRMGWAANRSIR